ncbi:unnamed protein product, partial [marine sediment metagenome]
FIYLKTTFFFYDFYLRNLNRDWKNSHEIFFERYNNANAHLLKQTIEETDGPRRFTMNDVNQRIKDGHLFYVAKRYGKIIGYIWYVTNEFRIPFFNGTIYLKPDEICAINAYIQKEL